MGQYQRHDQFDTFGKGDRKKREQARAIKRVRDRDTREIVGYLYEWNTGQLNVMWTGDVRTNVVYE